jgi:multiple sugar transport system permease protein
MIGPAILYIVGLVGFPFVLAVFLSLSDATAGSTSLRFVGLENFRSILESTIFRNALKNTFVFTIGSQLIVIVLGNVLARALRADFRGKWLVRLLILLPWVAPISLGTIGWKWIFDSIYSVINWTLQAVGVLGPNDWPMWLGQPRLAMASVMLVHAWRLLPFSTVIILAGLNSIPHEIQDAAAVDGAGVLRRAFQIEMPLLMPIMVVALLFGIVFTFTDMTVIYVLTRGGPYDTTQVLASLAFFTGILGSDLAAGAATSLFLFPMLLVIAVVMLRVARRAEVG